MTSLTASRARSYMGDRDHSSFGFAVRHMTVSTFRGSFTDVSATVAVDDDGALVLSGSAAVESISVRSPLDLRTHLLSEEFFDAARHPEITFASQPSEPSADGTITVRGELTIRGVTRPVVATGTWVGPVEDPYGSTRAALELTATLDRRDYGMTWNMALPKGGVALDNQVSLTVQLELIAD
jgi:polyisoprenoid-binding protein YceI